MSIDKITRQHLGDAALAAGHKVYGWCVGDGGVTYYADIGPDESISWRPHLDDGDAFRLLVALDIWLTVSQECPTILAMQRTDPRDGHKGTDPLYVEHDGTPSDAARAAREAVVLCAAEVGKRMREGGR
jgi:hypothetical protein